jgi:hypothetical protein
MCMLLVGQSRFSIDFWANKRLRIEIGQSLEYQMRFGVKMKKLVESGNCRKIE